jgi:hypothetical protein
VVLRIAYYVFRSDGYFGVTGSAAKYDDRAMNAHFRSESSSRTTSKSLIFRNQSLSLNHRVPGSSPGAPTKLFKSLAA